MSKVLHIFFAFYFILVSSGVFFGKHLCGNSVTFSVFGINLNNENSCCCDHSSEDHEDLCCKSETKILKADVQKLKTQTPIKVCVSVLLNLFSLNYFDISLIELKESDTYNKIIHPPPKSATSILFLIKKLLI